MLENAAGNHCIQNSDRCNLKTSVTTGKNDLIMDGMPLWTGYAIMDGKPLWAVCQYGRYAIMDDGKPLWTVCQYIRYAIMDGKPLWTICHYGRQANLKKNICLCDNGEPL